MILIIPKLSLNSHKSIELSTAAFFLFSSLYSLFYYLSRFSLYEPPSPRFFKRIQVQEVSKNRARFITFLSFLGHLEQAAHGVGVDLRRSNYKAPSVFIRLYKQKNPLVNPDKYCYISESTKRFFLDSDTILGSPYFCKYIFNLWPVATGCKWIT